MTVNDYAKINGFESVKETKSLEVKNAGLLYTKPREHRMIHIILAFPNTL